MPAGRILIIDDDREMCKELKDILKEAGLSVDIANSGRQGLEMAKKECYDVALLDLKMPEMDGYETLQRIKADCPGLKVIILTGSVIRDKDSGGKVPIEQDNGERADILKLADHITEKPFDIDKLLSVITGFTSS